MYNTNEYIGRVYGSLICLSEPYLQHFDYTIKTKLTCVKVFCKICEKCRPLRLNKLQSRNAIACSVLCSKIYLHALPINYWEEGGIDIEELTRFLLKTRSSKNGRREEKTKYITDKDVQIICDIYETQEEKCNLMGVKLYKGRNKYDILRTASLDRVDNLLGYHVDGNSRWVHKTINDMLNCMSDKRIKEVARLIVNNHIVKQPL